MRLLKSGTKIGNATVVVDIVKTGNPEIRPGRKMNARFLTDHDTGNSGRGANAESHNRYIHNMAGKHPRDTTHVSWHLTVDETHIYQHIPFDEIAWHCGDGTGPGNYSSVGIEKCMHLGCDRSKIEANAIALHAYLMKELNIPITSVHPHQHWSGKYCPQLILNKYGSFRPFRDKIGQAHRTGITPVIPVQVARNYFLNGDRGAGVSTRQAQLNQVGYKLTVDGIFGNATEAAVRDFQTKNGLAVDGVIGAATDAKLKSVIANLNKPVVTPPTVKPPTVKPTEKPEEENELDKELIVINTANDYVTARKLSVRRKIKVIERAAVKGKMAQTAYIVGGSTKGMEAVADKLVDLSGPTWEGTVRKVEEFLKK